jgi:hypothetical protein
MTTRCINAARLFRVAERMYQKSMAAKKKKEMMMMMVLYWIAICFVECEFQAEEILFGYWHGGGVFKHAPLHLPSLLLLLFLLKCRNGVIQIPFLYCVCKDVTPELRAARSPFSLAFPDYRSSQSIKSWRLHSENNFEKYSIPRRVCPGAALHARASFHLPRFYICLMQTWYNACRNL